MNTFKVQFLALEATVLQLKERLHKLEGTTPASPDCHYVSSEQEAGELSLDCMDAFRFVYTIPPSQHPNYTPTAGHQNPTCYTYSLINPNQDLKNYHITHTKLNGIGYTEYSQSAPHNGLSIITETPPDKLEQSDIQFSIHNPQNGIYSVLTKTKEMKEALGEKFFAYSKHGPNPYSEFVHKETIQFKQEYEILPHVSFFLTPLEQHKSNLICKILEITCKSVTFEISYINVLLHSSPDAILHWQVKGVKKEHNADLLS